MSRLTPLALPLALAALSWPASALAADAVLVRATNPLGSPRSAETLSVRLADLRRIAPQLEAGSTVVADQQGKALLSQWVDSNGDDEPDEIVFQADFGPGESKAFTVQAGPRRTPSPEQFRVYGRFVRERHDDFAWENDRVAHRMYGPDLETWRKEPLTSSGVDVWTKRTPRLVANEWYMTDEYHQDHGEGADLYSVGTSRGCGGLGIWSSGRLFTSRNFVRSRVLANGPIRLIFELDYAPWDAGGFRVAETKRVVLDKGSSFDRFESTFTIDGALRPLDVGLGIARHPGGLSSVDKKAGVLTTYEPLKRENGSLGCGLVADPRAVVDARETDSDFLLVTRGPTSYYAGFAWDARGDVRDAADWHRQVLAFARRVASPVRVRLGPGHALRTPELTASWAVRACDTLMAAHPDVLTAEWHYDVGLELNACQRVGDATGDKRYGAWVKRTIDGMLAPDGHVLGGYVRDDFNSDNVNMGKVVFDLYEDAKDPREKARYKQALGELRDQMKSQPRTRAGAFWHKKIYPNQQWLDGVFMTSPFLARYAVLFDEPALFDEVARQITLAEAGTRDPKSGLLYHGYDESRKERWADPKTGRSANFWGRGMGWYAMALVDVLERLPRNHPKRAELILVLERTATAIASVQDPATGVWWQVLDAPGKDKNYREASASAMFSYALSKAVRKGFLDEKTFGPVAESAYRGLIREFASESGGKVTLKSVCKVAGLGGTPYRDGSYDYYTSTEVVADDPKGYGAFILASLERDELRR